MDNKYTQQFLMWNVWNLSEMRAGGQVAGVGVKAAGYSRTPDSPNAILHKTRYGRHNDFSESLTARIMENHRYTHNAVRAADDTSGAGANTDLHTKFSYTLKDEYGNEFSGKHVVARLVAAGKLLGPKSWVGLTRAFKQASPSGGLNREEFAAVLGAFGLGVSPKEVELIFRAFDANNDGSISYDEFMGELRGELHGQRLATVRKAFDRVDARGAGRVPLSEISRAFNAHADQRVVNGDMSAAQAVQEFMSTFDFEDQEGWVSWHEFLEYYTCVSATIDNDSVFTLMVWNTWLGRARR